MPSCVRCRLKCAALARLSINRKLNLMASARWTDEEYAAWRARKRGTATPNPMPVARPVAAEIVRKAENKAKHDRNMALESDAKILLMDQLRDVVTLELEYRFQTERGYKSCRFDLAAVDAKIAIEIEGGHHAQGRHNRASGFEKDILKYNDAAIHGWRVLRFTYAMIRSGDAARTIQEALNA